MYWYFKYKMKRAWEEVEDMTKQAKWKVDTFIWKDYDDIVNPKWFWAGAKINKALKYMIWIPEFDEYVGSTLWDAHGIIVEFWKTWLGIKLIHQAKKWIAYNDIEKVTYEIRQGVSDTQGSSTTDGAILWWLVAWWVGAIVGWMSGSNKAQQSDIVLIIHHKLDDWAINKAVILGKQQDGALIRWWFQKYFPGKFEVLWF